MTNKRPPLDPELYYDRLGEGEWDRLDRAFDNRLELETTLDYLEKHLPETGRVLDVGGGAGRYAAWLAERGYEVTLVDLSRGQLDAAETKLTDMGLDNRVRFQKGDVRNLEFDSDAFDAALCLGGAVSHVTDESERETAGSELCRVTRAGGPVFVSVMGLLCVLQVLVQEAGKHPDDETELLSDLASRGTYDQTLLEKYDREPTSFACHYFRADELESLLESVGLDVRTLVGLEGVASHRRDDFDDTERTKPVREVVRMLREDRAVVDFSSHILAVCHV